MAKAKEIHHLINGVAVMISIMEEHGVGKTQALEGTGISPDDLLDTAKVVSRAQEFEIYRRLKNYCPEPDIGLLCGQRYHLGTFGMWALAFVSSDNFAEALDFAISHMELTYSYLHVTREIRGDELLVTFADQMDLGEHRQFVLERDMAAARRMFADALETPVPLSKVRFDFDEPDYRQSFDDCFGCPVEFKAGANQLCFPAEVADMRPSMADPYTAALAREQCRKVLSRLKPSDTFTEKVCKLLLENPRLLRNVESTADTLHMTSRTLRRRLQAEGTSFSAIITDIRRTLAIEYLTTTKLTLEAIASRLGYSDAVNFGHAFKRWTGKSPGAYRQTGAG